MTRYYLDAGAGGVAVGVHSTQFAIRDVGLYQPVLELAMQTARDWEPLGGRRPLVHGRGPGRRAREQAVREAQRRARPRLPRRAAEPGRDEGRERGRTGGALPRRGRGDAAGGLLPAARGGRHPPAGCVLAALRRNRQRGRHQDGAVPPLPHARRDPRRGRGAAPRSASRSTPATTTTSCWTCWRLSPSCARASRSPCASGRPARALERVDASAAVQLLDRIHAAVETGAGRRRSCWRWTARSPTAMRALFDVAHDFHGCIAGCHEVLRRQGLLQGTWCLDPGRGT